MTRIPFLSAALEHLAAKLRHDEPVPYLSISLGGVSPEIVAGVARAVQTDLARRAADLKATVYGTLEPPAEHLGRAVVDTGISLPDVEHRLIGHLPVSSPNDGPLQGCTCGHRLTWGGPGYSQHLATVALGLWQAEGAVPCPCAGQGGCEHTEHNPDDEASSSWPGFTEILAAQATEFLGRQVHLPFREGLPRGPQTLESARFDHLSDGDQSPDVVMVKLAGLEQPYALLPSDPLHVHDSR